MEYMEMYQDIPRLYTAIAEFLACLLYWFILPRRISEWSRAIPMTVSFLTLDVLWLIMTDHVPIAFWIPCMLVALGLMLAYLGLMVRGPFRGILYTALKALLVAEFMASLEWQLDAFARRVFSMPAWCSWILMAVVFFGVIQVVYLVEKNMHRNGETLDIGMRDLASPIIIMILSFLVSNLSFVNLDTPFSGKIISDIFTIRTLVDLAGLALVYAYQSHAFELTAEKELLNINTMLKAQYEHYRNYQESINLINFKYHDLKHQLAGLRAEQDPEKKAKWIDAMSRELEAYRPETQTGNRVLDGVLDQKMPLIRQNQMKFTCVADGKLLDFMHVTDICTIFGNALDNAIENLVTQPDPEKRLIHLTIAERKQFVYIEVLDYCDHKVTFRGGLPVTSKKDRENHGFGVKSIAYTAQKYGGNATFGVDKNMFEMKILIPIPEDPKSPEKLNTK